MVVTRRLARMILLNAEREVIDKYFLFMNGRDKYKSGLN